MSAVGGKMGARGGGATSLGLARSMIKAMFDSFVALVLLIVLSPVMAACAALIKLSDPRGRVFTHSARRDRRGREFELLGFRVPAGPMGAVMQKFDLDHLPELFNVVIGQMGMVGPRPQAGRGAGMGGAEDRESECVGLQPGLTGLWVLSAHAEPTPADLAQLERSYARTWSIAGDIRIIARTVAAVRQRR